MKKVRLVQSGEDLKKIVHELDFEVDYQKGKVRGLEKTIFKLRVGIATGLFAVACILTICLLFVLVA